MLRGKRVGVWRRPHTLHGVQSISSGSVAQVLSCEWQHFSSSVEKFVVVFAQHTSSKQETMQHQSVVATACGSSVNRTMLTMMLLSVASVGAVCWLRVAAVSGQLHRQAPQADATAARHPRGIQPLARGPERVDSGDGISRHECGVQPGRQVSTEAAAGWLDGRPARSVLCCAVLCCAVLCCAVLR